MPNGDGITKDTFLKADEQSKWAMTYDLLHEIRHDVRNSNSCHLDQRSICEERFNRIERNWSRLAGALIVIASIPSVIILIFKALAFGSI